MHCGNAPFAKKYVACGSPLWINSLAPISPAVHTHEGSKPLQKARMHTFCALTLLYVQQMARWDDTLLLLAQGS